MFNLLSIEFDNDKIKLIEGVKRGKLLSILKCLSINLPQNCTEDGKIMNMSIVKDLINKTLRDNLVKTKKAVFIINSNSIISRKIELPYLKSKKDTSSMIHYNLEEMFSANYSQYLFIHKISDIFVLHGVKYASYIIHGIPTQIYNQYMELSKSLKLELKKLDISSNCLENLAINELNINFKQYSSENINAFININSNGFSFSVLNRCINEFYRNYYINEHEVNIEMVAEDFGGYYSEEPNPGAVYTDEILKYIKYYHSINKSKVFFEKIYVYGDNCYPDIERDLSSNLDMNVELIQDISNINLDNLISPYNFDIKDYLNCSLALFNNAESSNFLTESQKFHNIKFNVGVAIMSFLAIITLFLAIKGITSLYKTISMENEIETMELFVESKENIKLNSKIEITKNQIEKMEGYLKQWLLANQKIINEDYINSNLLNEITDTVPNRSKVDNIYIDKNNIQLMCQSQDMKEISLFLSSLRSIDFIYNIYVPSIELTDMESYLYQVSCDLAGKQNVEE